MFGFDVKFGVSTTVPPLIQFGLMLSLLMEGPSFQYQKPLQHQKPVRRTVFQGIAELYLMVCIRNTDEKSMSPKQSFLEIFNRHCQIEFVQKESPDHNTVSALSIWGSTKVSLIGPRRAFTIQSNAKLYSVKKEQASLPKVPKQT